jgi:hypothetical protein
VAGRGPDGLHDYQREFLEDIMREFAHVKIKREREEIRTGFVGRLPPRPSMAHVMANCIDLKPSEWRRK